MPYPIDDKLVIGVSSSALFDLSESDKVFRDQGEEVYRKFQEENIDNVLKKGVAFSFVRRFLNLNKQFPDTMPFEVVLLSRNSPETGLRVFHSISHYGLDICRAAFFSGKSPFSFNKAFNVSLFLSANETDVRNATESGFPAGCVLNTNVVDDEKDEELRLAFDFDGVIIDDEAEKFYQKDGLLDFQKNEIKNINKPHKAGPLSKLFQGISYFQSLETEKKKIDPSYKKMLKTVIVTSRSAPSHERMINTLKSWHISVDEVLFLGGIEKMRFLEIIKPHMYFDDQMLHLESSDIPMVHIPFGVTNKEKMP